MIGSCEHYYGDQMPPGLYGQPTHPMSSVTNYQVTKCGWAALLGPGSGSPLMKLSDGAVILVLGKEWNKRDPP